MVARDEFLRLCDKADLPPMYAIENLSQLVKRLRRNGHFMPKAEIAEAALAWIRYYEDRETAGVRLDGFSYWSTKSRRDH